MPEALTCGTVGALTLGGGMSMCMTLEGIGFMIGGIAIGVVAAFYIALILIKSVVLFYGRKSGKDSVKQNKTYFICGCMLNILPFALSGIIVILFLTNMTFKYAGVLIYAAAAYTFYKIISSVIQINFSTFIQNKRRQQWRSKNFP